jgi:hypothetical protein
MRRAEGIVDIEALQLARLHRRAELIEQSRGGPRLARRILQTADGRLRGRRRTALRTAADRKLHQRIVPQSVEVDGILNASTSREIEAAFDIPAGERPGALFVAGDGFFYGRRVQLAILAAHNRIPAAYALHGHVAAGGLMSYGTASAFPHQGQR